MYGRVADGEREGTTRAAMPPSETPPRKGLPATDSCFFIRRGPAPFVRETGPARSATIRPVTLQWKINDYCDRIRENK